MWACTSYTSIVTVSYLIATLTSTAGRMRLSTEFSMQHSVVTNIVTVSYLIATLTSAAGRMRPSTQLSMQFSTQNRTYISTYPFSHWSSVQAAHEWVLGKHAALTAHNQTNKQHTICLNTHYTQSLLLSECSKFLSGKFVLWSNQWFWNHNNSPYFRTHWEINVTHCQWTIVKWYPPYLHTYHLNFRKNITTQIRYSPCFRSCWRMITSQTGKKYSI